MGVVARYMAVWVYGFAADVAVLLIFREHSRIGSFDSRLLAPTWLIPQPPAPKRSIIMKGMCGVRARTGQQRVVGREK
ncbi:hypothetical protein CROQUDRAFT_111227 [Cronartium quercuum f. sp. fusiforme G11]|uniref:Uncharacterized protein n=1 Tax=Cronartium quercuum f. sp. fusiforme G11 TaxID=708437 RepID=A0A9P6N6S8_9BASI|nr:hypothetical protein CROQUDRAFT_111227 [Cronartium quercuum f. sp. fusiforme G11]